MTHRTATPDDRIAIEWRARVRAKDESLSQPEPLTHFKDMHALVLIADPGSGKSDAFRTLADAGGGHYITARNFAELGLPAHWTEPVFIDGLDEISGGSAAGSTPLGQIRSRLQALGTPKFRLSCREADWRGNTDGDALRYLVGEENFLELHLAPLDGDQITSLVMHWQQSDEATAKAFVQEAENHDLDGLLDNPQTLLMLVKAIGTTGKSWPASKTQTYEMACGQLVREHNAEHLATQRQHTLPDTKVLDAAGYLCAILLLAGNTAIGLQRSVASEPGVLHLPELPSHASAPDQVSCQAALHSRLFRSDGNGNFWPVHRTVAEYLGANYLAARVHAGLPIRRVWALLLGQDAGVVPELRGLHAWLAATVTGNARTELIDHDPLGVVLHGDVRHFSQPEKLHLLRALQAEATRYAHFRSQSWVGKPFGALASADMQSVFYALLGSPDRSPAHQALLDCVLDAVANGHPMPGLIPDLELIVRDKSYWSGLRTKALSAWITLVRNESSWAALLRLLVDVEANLVEDQEDELLGKLLHALYPGHIAPSELWKYFHQPKAESLLGAYWIFWHEKLLKLAPEQDIPVLLDSLFSSGYRLKSTSDSFGPAKVIGELLVKGVTQHAPQSDTKRLFAWLSLGLAPHLHCPLSPQHIATLSQWLSTHPATYKALFECGINEQVKRTDGGNLWSVRQHLYGAQEPDDAGPWYWSLAERYQYIELRRQLIYASHVSTEQHSGADAAISLLEDWSLHHREDSGWVASLLQCSYPPDKDHESYLASENNYKSQLEQEERERAEYFRTHLPSFSEGPAHLGALAEVATAYLNFFDQSHMATPVERLRELLNNDPHWVELAIEGLRHCLFRDDLPTASEIVDLHGEGRSYTLAIPCLAAMDLRYSNDPQTAFDLPRTTLEVAVTFRLLNPLGKEPAWFKELLLQQPKLLSAPMEYLISNQISAKKENVDGLFALAHDESYAEVARQIVPALIAALPIKAAKNQLSSAGLLISALLKRLDRNTQLTILANKLGATAMDVAQRVYWLTAGTLLEPQVYLEPTRQFLSKSQARVNHLRIFVYELLDRGGFIAPGDVSTQSFLIELLGPRSVPLWAGRRGNGYRVTTQMEMGRLVGSLISSLADNPSDSARQALTYLRARTDMNQWEDALTGALYDQRATRRKALFNPAGVAQICDTLANTTPANAADLWALTLDHLTQLSQEIRNGNTNDYRQYWWEAQPREEDDCRDTLLSDLKRLLGPLRVTTEPEGRYADEKRADIKVSFAPHQIPIEIKRETHADLWKAIPDQLVAKYSREMNSDGYGVYIVFWFRGKFNAAAADGGGKPATPQELQRRLASTVPEHLRNKIAVLVVDCSKPKPSVAINGKTGVG